MFENKVEIIKDRLKWSSTSGWTLREAERRPVAKTWGSQGEAHSCGKIVTLLIKNRNHVN